jgi:hypothetical protein
VENRKNNNQQNIYPIMNHLIRVDNMAKRKEVKTKIEREPTEEIDLLDTMLASLVDLLIEKGIITEEEYEKRLKEKVKINSRCPHDETNPKLF